MTPPERAQLLEELVRTPSLNRFSDPHATRTIAARILDALDERHLLIDAGAPARITELLRVAFTEGLAKNGAGESWGARALDALFPAPPATPAERAALQAFNAYREKVPDADRYGSVDSFKRGAPGTFARMVAAVEAGMVLAASNNSARINTDKGE